MKKNLKRSLLLVFLVVFMCTCLAGCSEATNVSDVQVTYTDKTITVSSPKDNAFVLNIELVKNDESYSWKSENLYIASDISQSYELKDLVGGYISEDCQINSINVDSAFITDWGFLISIAFIAGILIGAIISLTLCD